MENRESKFLFTKEIEYRDFLMLPNDIETIWQEIISEEGASREDPPSDEYFCCGMSACYALTHHPDVSEMLQEMTLQALRGTLTILRYQQVSIKEKLLLDFYYERYLLDYEVRCKVRRK